MSYENGVLVGRSQVWKLQSRGRIRTIFATPSARCIFQRHARLGVGRLYYNVHDVFIKARYAKNETTAQGASLADWCKPLR